jgi:hypothetical protein
MCGICVSGLSCPQESPRLPATLDASELEDWSRYGKVRAAWEKWLRDPDDVFIRAEERRRELLGTG